MSLLLRRILGGFSWIDDILQLISAGPEGIFKGTSWWFAQLFVRVPYILPFFFYWNAVKGRYLMFVVCTSSMISSLLKYTVDSVATMGTTQTSRCYGKISISVSAMTTMCALHTLFDFEILWFDVARRNMYTILFALISFLLDCTFGNCMIISFVLSYLIAATGIRFRSTLVSLYELHMSKIWATMGLTITIILLLGLLPCHLKDSPTHSFRGGISTVVRPLGSVVGLIVCDKLDESARIRSHICGRGLHHASLSLSFVILGCFIYADLHLTFQSHIVAFSVILSLLILYTIIVCRLIPLLDLRQVEHQNEKFMKLLGVQCKLLRRRNSGNIKHEKQSGVLVEAVQKGHAGIPSAANQIGSRDREVADLMKITSTSRTADVLHTKINTKKSLKGDTSNSKVSSVVVVQAFPRCESVLSGRKEKNGKPFPVIISPRVRSPVSEVPTEVRSPLAPGHTQGP